MACTDLQYAWRSAARPIKSAPCGSELSRKVDIFAYNGAVSFPLLNTRLTVPPIRAGLVFRPRLLGSLQAGLEDSVRLILISAPAGSGKSTLISEWAARFHANADASSAAPVRFAWLSIDPADNQDLVFWNCLIGALQVVLPDFGQSEQRILSFSEAPPVVSILTSLLNQIGARSEKVVLILDDYHLITEPSIHEGITYILEHMPANMQLVIATRADPPLPLNRLRVRSQLLGIRAADLSFSLPESEMYLNHVMELGLSAGDLAALGERTEGWAAGLQLAAALLKDERRRAGDDPVEERLTALVTRLSGRHHLIADYLLDEVIDRQPEEIQRFLLSSSVLGEFCAPLCDALSGAGEGSPASQAVLEYLDRANIFLIPLDDEHTWFRYHHLFGDVLRIRLERTRPGAGNLLHQRASQWYEENGYPEEAIEHALAAQDHGRAAGLVEKHALRLDRQGRFAPLLRWLDAIPAGTALAHPRLGILGARALVLSGKLSAAEQHLQALETPDNAARLTPGLRGQIAAVRASAAILNADPAVAKEQSRLAIDLLPPGDPSRAAVLLSSGDAAMISGEISRGAQLLREAAAESRQNNDLSLLLMASAHLAEALWIQGRLRQAEAVCLEAITEVNSQLGAGEWPLPSLALIYTHLGGIKREWNDLEGAELALLRAVGIAEKCTYMSALVNAYVGLAALRRSQGRLAGAVELIEKGMHSIHRRESALFLDACQALRANYWAQDGNIPDAQRWAEERQVSAQRAIDYLGEFELTALARLWLATERADEADVLTGRLAVYAEASGQPGKAIEFLTLQALARRGAGRLDLAVQSLEQALILGEPEGYTRVFLDEGGPLLELLRRITRQKSSASAFARLLLSKTDLAPAQDTSRSPASQPHPPLVEPLTGRELAVLRQMAGGASNQEIAQRLVISIGTVKAHIYHITAKLGARSRTEAVARARDAGLLP